MMPRVILHNSVSLDGSLTNFEPHMQLHYQIVGRYKPEVHLIGSNTIKAGVELYGNGVPAEEVADYVKPKRKQNLPIWVIIDAKGNLKGFLHTCRRFELVKDVIILVSETTPRTYLQHLKERHYPYHVVGKHHVDLRQALVLLSQKYHTKTIVTDTGRILGNLLLEQGFVDEISLLVHPVIIGEASYNMFSEIKKNQHLKLKKCEVVEKNYIWLVYQVNKK